MSEPADPITKAFPTGDVLSAATGYLCTRSGLDGVYAVLGWMTDDSVFTHQLPRIGREAAPVILAFRPDLAQAYAEAETITRDNWESVLDTWIARYGETIAIPRMSLEQHERIDPFSELAEKIHPDGIVVIGVDHAAQSGDA